MRRRRRVRTVKEPVEGSQKNGRKANVLTAVTVKKGPNGARCRSHHDIGQNTGSHHAQGIFDNATGQSGNGGNVKVGPIAAKENDGARGGHERIEDQTTGKVAQELARVGRVLTEFGFGLENQSLVHMNVPIHERHGNAHVNVLKFGIVIVGHLAMQFKVAVLKAELQFKDTQIPRHAQMKAILELLQNLARQERHVPGAVQFHGRAHDKNDL